MRKFTKINLIRNRKFNVVKFTKRVQDIATKDLMTPHVKYEIEAAT
jgi:hypothetical protein